VQSTKHSLLGLALLLLFAIAALAKVTTHYDPNAVFSKYKTFSWLKEPNMKNPLMNERIVGFIDVQMNHKDFKFLKEGGDIGIAVSTGTREETTLNTFYSGFGGWRWHGGWRCATTPVETYEVETLVVDFFDTSTMEMIWRGIATETISDNPEKSLKELQKAIDEMFKQFPPKAKRITE